MRADHEGGPPSVRRLKTIWRPLASIPMRVSSFRSFELAGACIVRSQ